MLCPASDIRSIENVLYEFPVECNMNNNCFSSLAIFYHSFLKKCYHQKFDGIFIVKVHQSIVGTPLPPLIKGTKCFARKGSWCRNGWVATFFTTLQFSLIAFIISDLQSFELAMQDFHPRSHPSLVLNLVSFPHFWSILVV